MEASFLIYRNAGNGIKIFLQAAATLGCCLAASGIRAQSGIDAATEQVIRAPLFQDRLVWVGQQPAEAESQALLEDIDVFKTKGIAPGFVALEQFVAKYPH